MDIQLFKINKVFCTKKGHYLYHLIFKSKYEMGMFFLRYQEYYESINPEFRGKSFQYLDYLSWYVQYTSASTFNYPKNFIGYNLPSEAIKDCYDRIPKGDMNKYDFMWLKLYLDCAKESNGKFYIIGTTRKDATYYHELAHAFYYLEPAYKKEMDAITKSLSNKLRCSIFNLLSTIYADKVLNDELQAYMSTNSYMTGMDEISGFTGKTSKYEKVFQSWLTKLKLKI